MALKRPLSPRRFIETLSLESDPEVCFHVRFTAQDADELANYISPPRWGDLCRVACGFVQDWDGVSDETGVAVAWSLDEFYGRLTASERLEFAASFVDLVYGGSAPNPHGARVPGRASQE